MDIPAITKPFDNYKWRWMEFTPVESFNRPDILLGITRAIQACVGKSASSSEFIQRLEVIQNDLLSDTSIKLVPKDTSRNVLRRQGRYWRGLGILDKQSTRQLKLTSLGVDYANGVITDDDFINRLINTHELPNALIEDETTVQQWRSYGLNIKPLKLILEILQKLSLKASPQDTYLTPKELAAVVIPLAIVSRDATYLAEAILDYRNTPTKYASLPNCTPEANDKRMVREHLLILEYYGVLSRSLHTAVSNESERYYPLTIDSVTLDTSYVPPSDITDTDIDLSKQVPVYYRPEILRTKRNVSVTQRPNQGAFRRAILANFGNKCLLTGEVVRDVLVACHIHEVRDGGSDHHDNGILLRADLHILFDKNKLRISEAGDVVFSPDISADSQYHELIGRVQLPMSVNRDLLRRRFEYGRVVLPQTA